MGLNDPNVKMSKSFAHIRGHAIRILDEPKEIERSIMRAVTDSGNEIAFSDDPERAGVNNLLGIYKAITGGSSEEVERDFANARGYGDLKRRVAEAVIAELSPIRERYYELMDDVAELDRLLSAGAERRAGGVRTQTGRNEAARGIRPAVLTAYPLPRPVIPAKAGNPESPNQDSRRKTNPEHQPTYPLSLDGRRLG